jgi:DNA-binding HxlR family transcriptional regulator
MGFSLLKIFREFGAWARDHYEEAAQARQRMEEAR